LLGGRHGGGKVDAVLPAAIGAISSGFNEFRQFPVNQTDAFGLGLALAKSARSAAKLSSRNTSFTPRCICGIAALRRSDRAAGNRRHPRTICA